MNKLSEDELLHLIPNCINHYANKLGEIWEWNNGNWYKVSYTYHEGSLYPQVKLPIKYIDNKGQEKTKNKTIPVHLVIIGMFIGPKPYKHSMCCHKNDIKHDNRVVNLYWGNHESNMEDYAKNKHTPSYKIGNKIYQRPPQQTEITILLKRETEKYKKAIAKLMEKHYQNEALPVNREIHNEFLG